MSTFNRGLDKEFVDVLNEEYEKGGWLRGFVDDRDIFLAIRESYVNFYYRGCSLLRLAWKAGAMVGKIHYKYLLRPALDNPYIEVVNGRPDLPGDAKSLFLRDFNNIGDLKRAVQPYAGAEKTGVHDILISNHNIVDVEIAFGTGGTDEADASAPRVDFAAVQDSDEDAEIVFFEAKYFDNKALRASGDAKPDVVRQIETYSRKLRENRDAVIQSYRRACGNLTSVHGVGKRHPERHAMLEGIEDGSRMLRVDENPVLIVFGFDADQRAGKNWRPHREKLDTLLDGRVFFKGGSKKFVRGVSLKA